MSVWRRLTLRRADGAVYLDRWGVGFKRLGGVYLHRMEAPDPGLDLHDHPWTFVTIVLSGGYQESRATIREPFLAHYETRHRLRPRRLRLDECHSIRALHRSPTWTVVFWGPIRRRWGFYEPDGWVHHSNDSTERRPVFVERNSGTLQNGV